MTQTLRAFPRIGQEFSRRDGRLFREIRIGGIHYSSSVPYPNDEGLAGWWRQYLHGHVPVADRDRGELRTVELFSGPGGLFQGAKQAAAEAGYRIRSLAAVDEDADSLRVYASNHGTEITLCESVSLLVSGETTGSGEGTEFFGEPAIVDRRLARLKGDVDLLLAGPPCQGHSNLNNSTRRTDGRNALYLTVPAIAIALGVRMVIIENVPAVVRDSRGVVMAATALLGRAGYHVTGHVIAADRLGWPQTRRRFFLVAHRERQPIPLQELEASFANSALSVMWAIQDLQDAEQDEHMHRRTILSPENIERIRHLHSAEDRYDLENEHRPDCHKNGTTYTAVYGRMYPDRPAPTLTTGFMTPGRGRYVHPTRERVLTPREAARIQGFPDDYDFRVQGEIPTKVKLAKWIGDAVPMPLGHLAMLSLLGAGFGDDVTDGAA